MKRGEGYSGVRRLVFGLASLVLACLLPGRALAIQTVVVLDLDGYGVSYETTEVMSQGLRDGFLEEGTFDPLSAYDITEGLSAGQQQNITTARTRLAEARKQMEAGSNVAALRTMAEVLSIHEEAWSWVGRRSELADVHYYIAVAMAASGRKADAVAHLVEAFHLFPAYDSERAVNPPASMARLFVDAYNQLDQGERRSIPGAQIATIGDKLGARYVVTGYVVEDGTVHASLFQDGRLINETTEYAEELPLYPGDPLFLDIATHLVGGFSEPQPAPVVVPSYSSSGPSEFEDFHDIPSVEPLEQTPSSSSTLITDHGSDYSSSRSPRRGRRSRAEIHTDRDPVTEQWWFWTSISAVVVGGGVGLYFALRPDPVEEEPIVEEGDSYTIALDPSGL